MRGRRFPWAPSVVTDAVFASALVVAGLLELWASGRGGALTIAVALAGTAPLALRRRWPLAVTVVVMASVAALTVADTNWFSYAQLLAMLVAVYTVGAWAPAVRASVGLIVAVVAGVTNSVATAAEPEVGDVVFPLVLLVGPWLAGRALRTWRSRTAQLRRLTEQLAEEREARAALAVEAERARIAREMHDVLTQSLNAIVIHAEGAEEALDRDAALARAPLATIQQTGRAALRETRRMLGTLRSPSESDPLEPLPGTADLPVLVEGVRVAGLPVRLRVEGTVRPLSAAAELSVYRIVQQALTNTLTHAQAASADVALRYGPSCLEVEVVDDGRGDGAETQGSGYGLVGLRERAVLFGGSLTAGPRAGGGFAVLARLPLDEAEP